MLKFLAGCTAPKPLPSLNDRHIDKKTKLILIISQYIIFTKDNIYPKATRPLFVYMLMKMYIQSTPEQLD